MDNRELLYRNQFINEHEDNVQSDDSSEESSDDDSEKTLIVNFNSFGSSSLDFFVYTFTNTTDWILFHEVKQDVMLQVLKIIEAQGAECAYPTSTIHLAQNVAAPV